MQADPASNRADERLMRCLWAGLASQMDAWRSDWRSVIHAGSGLTLEAFFALPARTDREVFEAFAIALLSGNTRWDRIARVRGELDGPFQDYDPVRFAAVSDDEIDRQIVPWFRERRAGAAGLRAALARLRLTAATLSAQGGQAYLRDAAAASDGTPEDLAVLLGSSKRWKLPGFGIALSAEALRLLGIDLCKPDRHILRAMASWSLVAFRRWDRRGAFTAPQADVRELRETMVAVRAIADANGVGVSYANSVIWTAGAVSGARLANESFEAIRQHCDRSR